MFDGYLTETGLGDPLVQALLGAAQVDAPALGTREFEPPDGAFLVAVSAGAYVPRLAGRWSVTVGAYVPRHAGPEIRDFDVYRT